MYCMLRTGGMGKGTGSSKVARSRVRTGPSSDSDDPAPLVDGDPDEAVDVIDGFAPPITSTGSSSSAGSSCFRDLTASGLVEPGHSDIGLPSVSSVSLRVSVAGALCTIASKPDMSALLDSPCET